MWSERDRRYGGLQRRYTDFHGSTVRCLDPVNRSPVAFANRRIDRFHTSGSQGQTARQGEGGCIAKAG